MKDNRQNNMDSTDMDNLQMSNGQSDEIQQSLADVKVTEKCFQEELSAQFLENAAKNANDIQKVMDDARTSRKVGNGIINQIYDMKVDKPIGLPIIPQSTKDIVNEVKKEAKLDQCRTDSMPTEESTQIYNSLEEIYKDMLSSGMTMEALYEVVKKVQEKLQKTVDNGMYLQKGEL